MHLIREIFGQKLLKRGKITKKHKNNDLHYGQLAEMVQKRK
jgi:hypothetical protein